MGRVEKKRQKPSVSSWNRRIRAKPDRPGEACADQEIILMRLRPTRVPFEFRQQEVQHRNECDRCDLAHC